MPGSPPSSVTDPGTRPPPSTRSSSSTPVGWGRDAVRSTVPIGTGSVAASAADATPALTTSSTSSTSEFHAPHAEQRPLHFGSAAPHSVHRWITRRRPMTATIERGCARTVCPRPAGRHSPAAGRRRVHSAQRRRERLTSIAIGTITSRNATAQNASSHGAAALRAGRHLGGEIVHPRLLVHRLPGDRAGRAGEIGGPGDGRAVLRLLAVRLVDLTGQRGPQCDAQHLRRGELLLGEQRLQRGAAEGRGDLGVSEDREVRADVDVAVEGRRDARPVAHLGHLHRSERTVRPAQRGEDGVGLRRAGERVGEHQLQPAVSGRGRTLDRPPGGGHVVEAQLARQVGLGGDDLRIGGQGDLDLAGAVVVHRHVDLGIHLAAGEDGDEEQASERGERPAGAGRALGDHGSPSSQIDWWEPGLAWPNANEAGFARLVRTKPASNDRL